MIQHVGRGQLKTHSYHQLRQLADRNEHRALSGDGELRGAQGVVGVHERVHREVHACVPNHAGAGVGTLVERVDEYCDVMVPVQEVQLRLSGHDEEGVAELWELAHHEEVEPEPNRFVQFVSYLTDCGEDALLSN